MRCSRGSAEPGVRPSGRRPGPCSGPAPCCGWRSEPPRPVCRARSNSAWNTAPEVVGSRLPVGSSASSRLRLVGQGAGDGHALLFAAGQLGRLVLDATGQAQLVQHHLGARARLGLALAGDQLAGRATLSRARELRQQMVELVDEADGAPAAAWCAGRSACLEQSTAVQSDHLAGGRAAPAGPPRAAGDDLPEPDGPIRPTISPGQTSRSTPLQHLQRLAAPATIGAARGRAGPGRGWPRAAGSLIAKRLHRIDARGPARPGRGWPGSWQQRRRRRRSAPPPSSSILAGMRDQEIDVGAEHRRRRSPHSTKFWIAVDVDAEQRAQAAGPARCRRRRSRRRT